MRGGNFWIADAQLTKYEIQAASSQLVPKWVADQGSVFQQPLATIGEAIYSVRCQVGMPGTLVAATRMDEPEHFWETRLATPLVGEVEHSAFSIQDSDEAGGRITAVTCCGGLFQVDTGGLGAATVVQQPVATLDQAGLRRPITDVCRLGDGLLAVAAGGGCDWVAVVDPAQPQSQFRRLSLPDRLSCPPIGFAGGLLAPCKVGQVFLLDPRSGAEQVEPFQPLLTGTELTWRRPAVIGSAGGSAGQLVLADGLGKLYRVGVLNQAKPHLAALDEVQLSQPIVSPLAASDKVVCAVDAAGALCVFALPKLTPIEAARQVLSAGCNWGPQRVGNCIVLSTEDDQLLCLDDTGKLLWQAKLPYGPLAGTPRWDDGRLLMASASGVVRRVDVATGQELGKIETGLPLGTGPLLLGEQLVLGGHDGTLYVVATRGSGMGVGK
jgi:hypothetical protein